MAECKPHVGPTRSGRRFHAWCDCGWNLEGSTGWRTHATERMAMLAAINHVRKPLLRKLADERRNGGSTTYGSSPERLPGSGT